MRPAQSYLVFLCALGGALSACSSPEVAQHDGGFDALFFDVRWADAPAFDGVTLHGRDASTSDASVSRDADAPLEADGGADAGVDAPSSDVADAGSPDGGTDDSGVDAGGSYDAGIDVGSHDAGVDVGGSHDAGLPQDGGHADASHDSDASVPTDAGADASADGGVTHEACAEGTFDDDDSPVTECQPWSDCEQGEFIQRAGDATSDRVCAGCASGSYSLVDNAEGCWAWTDCASGTFVESEGSSTVDRRCAACPEGRYTSGENQAQCLEDELCAAGTVQTHPGTSGSPAECELCVAGEYCAGEEVPRRTCPAPTWDHDADPATACADWTECVPGTHVQVAGDADSDRVCEACLVGTFTDESNLPSCQPWRVCGPGEAPTRGTASRDRECTPVLEM